MNPRTSLNSSLGASIIALMIAAVIVIPGVFSFLGSVFGAGAGDGEPAKVLAMFVDEHEKEMQRYQDRFNGRSVFFKPPAPRRAPPPPPRVVEQAPPPPPLPPGPPASYTGPSIIYAIGDTVRFMSPNSSEDPVDIRVGEEKFGVRVIAIQLPWTVKIGHKNGEYDVPIFQKFKTNERLLAQAPTINVIPNIIEIKPGADEPVVSMRPKGTGSEPTVADKPQTTRLDEQAERGRRIPGRNVARPSPRPQRGERPSMPDPDEGENVDDQETESDEDMKDEDVQDTDEEDSPENLR